MTNNSSSNEKRSGQPSMYITGLLGQGKFLVYHAQSSNHKVEYALKLFPQDGESLALFSRELRSLAMLNHPNIIKYISHSKMRPAGDCEYNMLITEYAPHGDFYDLVMSKGLQGDEKLVRHFFHQLVSGLEYLHSQHHIAHCDLKLENLLLGKDGLLKIADFDQAHTLHDDTTTPYGTKGYRAPEVVSGTCQNVFAADIFSAGVLLYVLVTGEMPFVECEGSKGSKRLEGYEEFCETNDLFWCQKAGMYPRSGASLRNKEFRRLINGMLEKNVEKRWSIEQIKQSKWYKGQMYYEEELEAIIKRIISKRD